MNAVKVAGNRTGGRQLNDDLKADLIKVDELRERLAIDYAKAKDLLDQFHGDVLAALAAVDKAGGADMFFKQQTKLDRALGFVQKGNESSVAVNRHGRKIFRVPLNAAMATTAACLALYPLATAAIIGAAWYTDWSLRFDRSD